MSTIVESSNKINSSASSNSSSSDGSDGSDDSINDDMIDWSFKIFNDKYLLLKKLGKGAYCSVWLCYDIYETTYYAIKIYNREDYYRAIDEIENYKLISNLNIKNITRYINVFKYNIDVTEKDNPDETFMCCIMPLCGYSLYDIIKMFKNKKQIPIIFIYCIISKTISVLNDIHNSGLVHADIKPENILLNQPSLENAMFIKLCDRVKILSKFKKITKKNKLDFVNAVKTEITKYYTKELNIVNFEDINIDIYYDYIFTNPDYNVSICDMGTAVKANDPKLYKKYTIYYRAPETILKLNYNYTYDYWSFGCCMYELLTGDILFDVSSDLELLYQMNCKLGPIPKNILKESSISQQFYESKLTRLRGYKEIEYSSIYKKLFELINIDNIVYIQSIINVIINCLNYQPNLRTLN